MENKIIKKKTLYGTIFFRIKPTTPRGIYCDSICNSKDNFKSMVDPDGSVHGTQEWMG